MGTEGTIDIKFYTLKNICVVEFISDAGSYHLTKADINDKMYDQFIQVMIECLSKDKEEIKLGEDLTNEEAVKVWDRLIELEYESVTQLDNCANGTDERVKAVDNNLVAYKIRHKFTGLYSKGGEDDSKIWTKKGKTWSQLSHIKSHLSNLLYDTEWDDIQNSAVRVKKTDVYKDAEIVLMKEVKTFDMSELDRKRDEDD
jgi:hypothetical protein